MMLRDEISFYDLQKDIPSRVFMSKKLAKDGVLSKLETHNAVTAFKTRPFRLSNMQQRYIIKSAFMTDESASESQDPQSPSRQALDEIPAGFAWKAKFDHPRNRYRVNDIESSKAQDSKSFGARHLYTSESRIWPDVQGSVDHDTIHASEASHQAQQPNYCPSVSLPRRWIVAVHGGAGNNNPDSKYIKTALDSALRGAAACLRNPNASAEDAVVAALTVLEHNRRFNCGIGSMPTVEGQIEQDALIVDRHGRSGAIAGAPFLSNGIAVANAIRIWSQQDDPIRVRSTCLSGQGAADFARRAGIQLQRNFDLMTPSKRKFCNDWREHMGLEPVNWDEEEERPRKVLKRDTNFASPSAATKQAEVTRPIDAQHTPPALALDGAHSGVEDTVGVIVLDRNGNLACGCSSGGPGLKDPGRVGPAAIHGAGASINSHNLLPTKTSVLASGSGGLICSTLASRMASERLFYCQAVDENMRLGHCPDDMVLPLYIRNEFLVHPSVTHSRFMPALGLLGLRVTDRTAQVQFAFTSKFFPVGTIVEGEKRPTSEVYMRDGEVDVKAGVHSAHRLFT